METSRITIRQDDKTYTNIFSYPSDLSEPIGSIVLLHGMAEHHGRYKEFINFLNSKGYDCYIYDHRGHGSDIRFEDLGHIADEDGYTLLIQDAIGVLEYVKGVNRGKKLVLFGHSMGSILAQCVLQQYSDNIDACICMGSANPPHRKLNSGIFLADFVRMVKKPRHISPYLSKKITGYKEFAKISNRTSYDWLTRDNQRVGTYISDPLCGFTCTAAFYCDLLQLTSQSTNRQNMKKIRNDLPLIFLAGSHDPVGDYGSGVAELFESYQRLHFTNVDCIIYDEARHELLNEINRDEVMKDIAEWLNKVLNNRNLTPVVSLSSRSKAEKAAEKAAAKASKKKSRRSVPTSEAEYVSNTAALAGDADDDDFNDLGYFDRTQTKDEHEQ